MIDRYEHLQHALATVWGALGGLTEAARRVSILGEGSLPSAFNVTDLAGASVGAAALAIADLVEARHRALPAVTVDRRLASFWFDSSLRPEGWQLPPVWDAIAGDYRTADGWIRLHTNAPHHRLAALAVLDAPADRAQIADRVRSLESDALEQAIVDAGGCAAAMRSVEDWSAHAQGQAVAREPLLHLEPGESGPSPSWTVPAGRPLQGVRVLDLTRVLAGPVATRTLAGFGAEVLRIDPPDWDEPAIVPGVALGKRCARLDLRTPSGRNKIEHLLAGADILVHGYRPGALEGLGLGAARRRAIRPGLIDVSLDAYGWSGPWQCRRGFDSLVQMSAGLAGAGMRWANADRPTPLPVQALDHATGYLMAAAAIRGLTRRLQTGAGVTCRTSLARTARLLTSLPKSPAGVFGPQTAEDSDPEIEITAWGPARRLRPPCAVEGAPMRWDLPAAALGSSAASWVG